MDRSNSSGSMWRQPLIWLIAAAFVIVILLPMVAIADSKQDSKPANVTSPNDDFTPKQFGKPLAIEFEGKEIRTIFMFEGRSTADQRDPARVIYYHGLDLALVPRNKPLSSFPTWVQDVTQRDDETVIEIRFRLSSPKLRSACEAKLNSDMRDFFNREKMRLKVPALKVEVQKVPAWELFIAIQDRATNLTLAYDSQHIANLGEDVLMSFRFKADALALFMRCHKEGKLQFKPYYKVRADQIITGEKQTDITYNVGLKVKQLLDHRQQSKLKNDDEYTVYPILQDHVNRISRQVTMAIKSKIVASDPAVITFLHNDTMLVSSCFDPANTMSYADFQKAFPKFSEAMLAEYLKPYTVTKQESESSEKVEGKQHTDEKTSKRGGGIGLSLSVGPLSLGLGGSTEGADRVLDTIYNATGIRFTKGTGEQYYKPAEIKVFKLAQGYEEKKLNQASSITLTKGALNSHLEESPFPQTYIAEIVDNSLAKTLNKNDHVARLLVKKAGLQTAVDAEFAKVENARSNLKGSVGSINTERRKLHDAHVSAQASKYNAGRSQGMVEWIIHAKKVWGWNCPDGNAVNDRSKDRDAAQAGAEANNGVVAQANAAIDKHVTDAGTADAAIAVSQKEIVRLRGEIDKVTKEILSILER